MWVRMLVALSIAGGLGCNSAGPSGAGPRALTSCSSGPVPLAVEIDPTPIDFVKPCGESADDRWWRICAPIEDQAEALVAAAVDPTPACTRDDECVAARTGTTCSIDDERLTNVANLPAIEAARAQASATVCPRGDADGCWSDPGRVDPNSVMSRQVIACVAGLCRYFVPAPWRSLVIDYHAGRHPFDGVDGCEPGADCQRWTLTPDGQLTRVVWGQAAVSALPAEALAMVDQILRGETFRWYEVNRAGLRCEVPDEDDLSVHVDRGGWEAYLYPQGCLDSGTENQLTALYRLVTAERP